MRNPKLGMCLLVSSLVTTASFTASASCGGAIGFNNVSKVFSYEGVKWFRYDTSGADVNYSSFSTVWNNNSSASAKLILPLYGSHAIGDPIERPLRLLGAWVELTDENAGATTCTLRAWDSTQTFVVSNSVTTPCNMWIDVNPAGYAVSGNVRCTLPPKASTHYSEIPRTTEAQWFW